MSEDYYKFRTNWRRLIRGSALGLKLRALAIIQAQPGMVWTPVDFVDLAPRASVDKLLQRLVHAGELRRIHRGLYDRPRTNSLTGFPSVPDHLAVLDAVARRDQIRVLVDGMTAANDLGFTTAVPARILVLTDARLQPIRLGNLDVCFKTVAPSRLYWAGRPTARVVQALYWLRDLLSTDGKRIRAHLAALLADPVHGPTLCPDLQHGLHTLPTWMQSVVRDALVACELH